MAIKFKMDPSQQAMADALNKALAWVVSQAERDEKGVLLCPYCGSASIYDSDEALSAHIGELHVNKAVEDFEAKQLGAFHDNIAAEVQEDENKILASLGITPDDMDVVDDLDGFDHFEMPKDLKAREKKEGGRYRFVTPSKFSHWRNQGAETVRRPDDLQPAAHRVGSEDNTFRANEMILMWFPPALCSKRDRIKRARTEEQTNGLISSQEQRARQISDVGKVVYEHYRKRNMPHNNAMMLARRVEKQYTAGGNARPSSGRAPDGNETQITHGKTPY